MDPKDIAYLKRVLTVIAGTLLLMAAKQFGLMGTVPAQRFPTRGDFAALREMKDDEAAQAESLRLTMATPIVWVKGGSVDAEVSGSVSIEQ